MTRLKPSILAVDDQPQSLALLVEVLGQEGYEVRAADSGRLALASAAAHPPDLILLDLHLPDMDGVELFTRLQSLEKTHETPVMFISGSANFEHRLKGLTMGAVDFLTKPFRREELVARVRTHLELGRLRGNLEAEVARRTAELRTALDRLSETEERFRLMADTAPVLIWLTGPDMTRTFFNKGWLAFTDRSMEQQLGNRWLTCVHPDDRDMYVQEYMSAAAARREFEIEYRLHRADGEYRWMLSRGVPRFLADGSFAGYIGCGTDITDSRRVREETYDRQRAEGLRVLANGIAHDFKNIAAAILLQVEDAEQDIRDGLTAKSQLIAIKTAASRASDIVDQLMIYSGQENASLESCDVSGLVADMVQLLKISIPKNIKIETELAKDAPHVWGNATRIRQLVMNLVINASEAIGREPGVITIATSRAIGNFAGDHLRLQVTDTGCGMTEEIRKRIFDPFFTTKPVGHGLGLAVIDGIVRSHNGSINVVSAPGKGTTFEIQLPAVPARQPIPCFAEPA